MGRFGDANIDHFVTLETMRPISDHEIEYATRHVVRNVGAATDAHEILMMIGLEESPHIGVSHNGLPSKGSRLGIELAAQKAKKMRETRLKNLERLNGANSLK